MRLDLRVNVRSDHTYLKLVTCDQTARIRSYNARCEQVRSWTLWENPDKTSETSLVHNWEPEELVLCIQTVLYTKDQTALTPLRKRLLQSPGDEPTLGKMAAVERPKIILFEELSSSLVQQKLDFLSVCSDNNNNRMHVICACLSKHSGSPYIKQNILRIKHARAADTFFLFLQTVH